MFLTVFSTYLHTENTVRNITKIDQIDKFGLSKKAAVVSNFCLLGKIRHDLLVTTMIELACQTFMQCSYASSDMILPHGLMS